MHQFAALENIYLRVVVLKCNLIFSLITKKRNEDFNFFEMGNVTVIIDEAYLSRLEENGSLYWFIKHYKWYIL